MSEPSLQTLHIPERLEDETFEAYKQRRKVSKIMNKAMKHILFWDSSPTFGCGVRLDGTPRGNTYRKPQE